MLSHSEVASTFSTTSAMREAGMASVISAFDMPVRTRLSWQPVDAAMMPFSFAIATMWHWGLPSIARSG